MLRLSEVRNFDGSRGRDWGEVGKMCTMLSGWFRKEYGWGFLSLGGTGVPSLKGLAVCSALHPDLRPGLMPPTEGG
jgi:hypothetical protein